MSRGNFFGAVETGRYRETLYQYMIQKSNEQRLLLKVNNMKDAQNDTVLSRNTSPGVNTVYWSQSVLLGELVNPS